MSGSSRFSNAQKIPIHLIVGTSSGSFVGSLYAYGLDVFQLQKMALAIQKDDVVDLTIPDNGFVRGEKLENFVNRAVQNCPLERLRIPFLAVATNVQTGEETVFATGNTGKAVRASCSIPGIFQPVRIGEKTYVDGGVVSPVAVDAARKAGADVVIAVDISAGVAGSTSPGDPGNDPPVDRHHVRQDRGGPAQKRRRGDPPPGEPHRFERFRQAT